VGRPGNAGSVFLNPAGIADANEPQLVLSGSFVTLGESFTRTGEPKTDLGRTFGAFGLAVATPLPGVLHSLHAAFALDLPAAHLLKVEVPVRGDQPTSVLYGARPDRISALLALAYSFGPIEFGAGLAITPGLDTPTEVQYVAGRDPSVDKSVVVRLDRSLTLAATPILGVRAQPAKWLGIGLVYRGAASSVATGSQRTVAGGIVADDPIDFYQFWSPAELAFGAAWTPARPITLSTDLTFHEWSQFRSGFDAIPSPAFHDTLSLRAGISWLATRYLTLRGGAAFEPSPIPEQIANTNYLGANTTVLSLGAGLDLRPIAHLPMSIDAHVRARLSATQTAHKDPSRLDDANTDLPGRQIDNLGYPGTSSSAHSLQLGLAITFYLSKERP
jgi:hypothetical protein